MSVYIVLVVFLLLLYVVYPSKEMRGRLIVCSFLLLFILMGLREASVVGNDSASSYRNHYLWINSRNVEYSIRGNSFFYIIMKAFSALGLSYQFFIMFEAAFVCYSYARLVKKYSANPFLSTMWFIGMLYYSFLFSALKQAYAMAFICYAFDAIIQKKPIKFVICVVIASQFHFPAAVFLPAYWIVKVNMDKHFLFLLFAMLIVVYFFRSIILQFISDIYYGDENGYTYSNDAKFMGTKVILMIMTIVAGVILRKPDRQNDFAYTSILAFMCISVVFQTFCYYNNIFERMADYYYQFSILYIPMILEKDRICMSYSGEKRKQNASTISTVGAIVIATFCIFNFLRYTLNDPALNPFVFFWQA